MVAVGAIALSYFIAGRCAVRLLSLSIEASPWWPGAGIALGALLLRGQRVWPGVWLGSFFLALSLGASQIVALGPAFSSSVQAVVGAMLLRRLGFDPALKRLRDVFGLVAIAAMGSTVLGASIGTVLGVANGSVEWANFTSNWLTLWMGDSTSIVLVTPLLTLGKWDLRKINGSRLQAVVGLVLLLGVCWAVFGWQTPVAIAAYPLEFLPFPFIVWAAVRCGQPGVVLTGAIVSSLAIWGASQGNGPFLAKAETLKQAVLFSQVFVGAFAITALMLAAAVAERDTAEELMRQKEASLANAQRIAKLGNWDYDLLTQQWRWSDEMFRLWGYFPGEFVPTQLRYLQAIHPDDRLVVERAISNVIRCQYPYCIDYRIILPDGSDRIIRERVEMGETSITGTVQDVTDGKRSQAQLQLSARQLLELSNSLEIQVTERTEELQQKMQELAASNQLKNAFLDAVSHDLRTTIMGMVMVLKNLLNKPGDSISISRSLLERMMAGSDRQLSKIDSLLEVTELEIRGIVLNCIPLHIDEMIQEIIADTDAILTQNQANLTLQLPTDLPIVYGDDRQLRRVFKIFIENAVKHNPPGVELTIGATVESEVRGTDEIGNCSIIRCYLTDNGVGMSPETRDRLFELHIPHSTETRHLKDIGLGLYLCRQIIAAHGGQIGVDSTVGMGSTFWFTLRSHS